MPETGIGPYRLLSQLGAGGMGEVYRALDPRIGREVALKLLPEALALDTEPRRRFEQEARLAASLNHPNIMAIYDVGLDHHPPYIVAELVNGESLRSLIAKGPLPPRKAIEIASQIAAGLSAAHSAGIVHRDLKPENVMITPDGIAKILDFGIARMQTQKPVGNETITLAQTAAGAIIGTAGYMSPEQACGKEVDHRSDQFSLGLVLYEMLSGKQAFQKPSAVQTMAAIVDEEAPPIERPVPTQLRWILERCLSKEPEGRYESTRDLARELTQLRERFGEITGAVTGQQPVTVSAPRRVYPWLTVVWVLAGAAIAWCAAALLRDPRAVDLSRYHITPFATALTVQANPSWSPDGRSIAFLGNSESGKTRLFVQAIDAATAVEVGGLDARAVSGSPPFWSPDSRSIYFRCACGEEDNLGLCRIPATGGASVIVQVDVAAASLSPDGKTLVTLPAEAHGDPLNVWIASPPEAERYKYSPMPFETTQTYNLPAIAFSPDGKQLLLSVALDTRGETSWILPWPPGTARRIFSQGSGFTSTPQLGWMPDSEHFIFSAHTANTHSRLFMAGTGSQGFWPILTQDRPAVSPSVSPDGTQVAYTSALSHADIIAVPVGDGPIQTLLGSSRDEERVDASPVAQQLVYVTDRRGVQEVWIKGLAEDSDRLLLTPGDFQTDGEPAQAFINPVFSPDGRRVAVSVNTRSGIHIYTVFAAGGTPVRATSASGTLELCPTWSPDGTWLAYSALEAGKMTLEKVRPGTGDAPVTVAELFGSAAPVWSPTGEWIASHDLTGHLAIVAPDGKNQRLLPGDEGPVAWSHDGKTLFQIRKGSPALVAVDVLSGKQRTLRDLGDLAPFSNGNPGLSAALTSDQKNIVYAVNRPRQEIWILSGIHRPTPWYSRLMGN